MVTSMEDIAAVYKERDGISCTETATMRKEQLELLKTELYELAKDTSSVATYLHQFEYGILSWEEMLLQLSIYLVKQNKELFADLVKARQLQPAPPTIVSNGTVWKGESE